MAKIDNEENSDFEHQDFLKVGWLNSEMPKDDWQWDHLLHSLPLIERVQSKWREKFYHEERK